jgi:hypothetical protein
MPHQPLSVIGSALSRSAGFGRVDRFQWFVSIRDPLASGCASEGSEPWPILIEKLRLERLQAPLVPTLRGSIRTRSAMILRNTSVVPPYIAVPGPNR